MQLANKHAVCVKCNGEITARVHYCAWSKKTANKIWHIRCDNPGLTGFDPTLVQMPSTFFSAYDQTCKICQSPINTGDLAAIREGFVCHCDCKNPSGLQASAIKMVDPVEPIEPIEPKHAYPFNPIGEPKPTLNATNDGLLNLIVDSVAKELTNKVNDAIGQVKEQSRLITDRLEKELSEKLSNIAIPSIEIKRPDLPTIKLDMVHKQYKSALQILAAKKYLYLWGAPGGGKSEMFKQLAEGLGVRYTFLALSQQSPEYWISGYDSPIDGKHYPSEFADFVVNGGLFVFEEIDGANDNLRTTLNPTLANGHFKRGHELVKKADSFYCGADGNTAGRGAHPAFPERTAFDAAFAARWFYMELEYDWSLAKQVTKSLNPDKDNSELVKWFKNASSWALAQKMPLVLSPRELYDLVTLRKLTDLEPMELFDGILRGLDIISKEKLLQNFPLPTF